MGGKGRRRREKNYIAAHGGNNSLPPPPNAKDLEALPYKLRKIIQLKDISAGKQGAARSSAETVNGKTSGESLNEEKPNPRDAQCMTPGDNMQVVLEKTKNIVTKDNVADADSGLADERKKKTKEKNSKFVEKRKTKCKKTMLNETLDFPGREDVKFGEVVQAPPKLSLPKVPKNFIDASKERLRLQAVELYRKRRAWESRPGINLPSLGETST
ncbi:hypothetical protein HPP92_019820 [Vanilla planifolia]|uniref:Uncharacterized protein n=1 Tax=Vanilla planifolia TaxID=51239 RepID=A0A835UN93_VANPL|nr:hypothetical protein HPP92_019820 [Vanilla planifolia]